MEFGDCLPYSTHTHTHTHARLIKSISLMYHNLPLNCIGSLGNCVELRVGKPQPVLRSLLPWGNEPRRIPCGYLNSGGPNGNPRCPPSQQKSEAAQGGKTRPKCFSGRPPLCALEHSKLSPTGAIRTLLWSQLAQGTPQTQRQRVAFPLRENVQCQVRKESKRETQGVLNMLGSLTICRMTDLRESP